MRVDVSFFGIYLQKQHNIVSPSAHLTQSKNYKLFCKVSPKPIHTTRAAPLISTIKATVFFIITL